MKLYIVATPIGNLGDISFRAVEVLKAVDVIACEDTRHTKILLDKYGIQTKTIAYHKFNEKSSSEGIIKLLKEDKAVALVSDAGMPLVCDPGYVLVNRLKEEKIDYTVIPGANAMLCALVMSGFDTSKFAFFGFLSEKNKERTESIKGIAEFDGTSIIYSSKHNINKDLTSLRISLHNRKVCVVNEISKIFEKVQFFDLDNAKIDNPTGEYVVVLEAGHKEIKQDVDIVHEVELLCESGMSKNDACKQLAKTLGMSKRDIYNQVNKKQTDTQNQIDTTEEE